MEFSYFIARNRFALEAWLSAMDITTFDELLNFCRLNGLNPPSACPPELAQQKNTADVDTSHIRKKSTVSRGKKNSAPEAAMPGDTKKTPVSQNLSDHGVYVDSSEALATPPVKRAQRSRKKVPIKRGKNVKKN